MLCLIAIAALAIATPAHAAHGRVIKVLPLLMDTKGQVSVSPSLYDRDAYQAILRQHPEQRSGIRFDAQWKTKGAIWSRLKLRVEVRGVAHGDFSKELVVDRDVEPTGWFSRWTSVFITGEDYKTLGEVTAWRVTLWEGDQLLGEQRSFLW